MRKILLEQAEDDPFILVKFMHRAIKAILELRPDTANPNLTPKSGSQKENYEPRLEALLQKAENDIRNHIRVILQILWQISMRFIVKRSNSR